MSDYGKIRQAILDRDIVTATYDGYYREVCPHAVGREEGREKLFCYQFGGETSKGSVELQPALSRWRCLFIDQMHNVSVRAARGQWHTADNHSRAQTCIKAANIDVEVSY